MLKLTFTFLLLFSSSLFSQKLSIKQEKAIRNTIASQFGELHAQSCLLQIGAANFQYLDGDTLFNPQGFHYVFHLKGDSLERLDHSLFHGGDNNRFLFTYNHNLYALGGYGYFTTNNNLKYFNLRLKEWCYVKTVGDVPPFILGPAFKHGEYIYSFNNFKAGNNVEPDLLDSNDYRLNLKTMQWQRISSSMDHHAFFPKSKFIFMRDYLILFNDLKTMVIATHLNQFKVINNEDYGIGLATKLNLVNGNSCTFNRFNNIQSKEILLDFDNIWKENIIKAKDIVWKQEEPVKTNTFFISICIIIVAIGISFVSFFTYVKRKKIHISSNPIDIDEPKELILQAIQVKAESHTDHKELKRITQVFMDLTVSEINWDEMDKILNISHLEGDSRKLRRHRLLKDFPEGMITRNKAENDKRRFTFLLNRAILEKFYNSKL
jgi:hypothetical protein